MELYQYIYCSNAYTEIFIKVRHRTYLRVV